MKQKPPPCGGFCVLKRRCGGAYALSPSGCRPQYADNPNTFFTEIKKFLKNPLTDQTFAVIITIVI